MSSSTTHYLSRNTRPAKRSVQTALEKLAPALYKPMTAPLVTESFVMDARFKEETFGLNDNRPKLMTLLTNPQIGIVGIEHKERLTRFGFNYIARMMELQGRRIEVILPGETENELVADFVAVITSLCARIYGQRHAKRQAEKIKQCIEQSEQSNEWN